MISVKFNLKHKDKVVSNIFMSVYYGAFKISLNKKTGDNYRQTVFLRYYIGDSVHTKYWLSKTCRVKVTNAYPANKELNTKLQNIENRTKDAIRELQNKGIELNNDVIKEKLNELFRSYKDQSNKLNEKDLMSFIPVFIETSNNSVGTKKSYRRVLTDL